MNDYLASASMYITKATNDGKVMRWAAVNSDTDPDSYKERMSLELYKDFIRNIQEDIPMPEVFRGELCSDFWDGGMPYVSISHYSDVNGDAVPGEPIQLYVEGNGEKARLKAKGILYDTPLGHAVWRSLKEDKNKSPDEKIRISIGFLDLAHKHGENGELFVRDSLISTCEQCKAGVGDKIYVKGYLIHLALTRVPVNKRTEMVLEEKSMTTKAKKTRKDDAASIVGKDLAEEIDVKERVHRSDLVVEMSEAENTSDDVEVQSDEPAVEPVVESTPEPVAEPVVEQSETPVVEESVEYSLPYGGATSMKEAKKAQEAKQEMFEVMDMFSMFQNVAWNIIDRGDVTDKKAAFAKAVDEFKGMLAAKAMVEFAMVEKSEPTHPLKPAIDALLENIDNSFQLKGDVNEKLASINPALQSLGTAITDYVSKSDNDEPAPAQNVDIAETLKNLIQPLIDNVSVLTEKVGVLESKSTVQAVESKSRIPAPRTHQLPPSLLEKKSVNTSSIRAVINRSVGLPENS